jgi:hypothetical protein
VHALGQVALDDQAEVRVREHSPRDAIDERRKARDRRDDHDASGAEHAARLAQRLRTVGRLGQVVERAEQQHGVGGPVFELERPRVAQPRADARRPRLFDVQLDRVDQLDVVAALDQRDGVGARPAADVEDARRRRRQQPPEQVQRALALDPRPGRQPVALEPELVVRVEGVVEAAHGRASSSRHACSTSMNERPNAASIAGRGPPGWSAPARSTQACSPAISSSSE